MKRAFLFVLFILITLDLSASYFISNALGQEKGRTEKTDGSEWVLFSDGDTEILYHNGTEYYRKTFSPGLQITTSGEREERLYFNSDGNIERKIITTPSSREEYNYIYSGNLLCGYNYSRDGNLEYKMEYITTSDGSLLYYREKDEGFYITDDWFVSETGEKIKDGGTGKEENASRATADGGYEEEKDGIIFRYDTDGRLVSEKGDGRDISYVYSEDGRLERKTEKSSLSVYVTEYEGEGEVLIRYDKDGVRISERRTLEDGRIEERRFLDGEAKYVFIYDSDGRRIREAYAL